LRWAFSPGSAARAMEAMARNATQAASDARRKNRMMPGTKGGRSRSRRHGSVAFSLQVSASSLSSALWLHLDCMHLNCIYFHGMHWASARPPAFEPSRSLWGPCLGR
jgi:hypothetical protein